MNKYEFLGRLSERLSNLTAEDRKKATDFYAEMIDDRIEEGMSEEEAVQSIGDPEGDAREMLSAMGIDADPGSPDVPENESPVPPSESAGPENPVSVPEPAEPENPVSVPEPAEPENPVSASEPEIPAEAAKTEETGAPAEKGESGHFVPENDSGISNGAAEHALVQLQTEEKTEEGKLPAARKRRIWPVIAGAVLLVAVVIFATGILWNIIDDSLDRFPFGFGKTSETLIEGEVKDIVIDVSSADVRFEASGSEHPDITAVKAGKRFRISYDDETRTLRIDQNRMRGFSFGLFPGRNNEVVIEGPANLHPWGYYELETLEVRTSSGDIRIPSCIKVNEKLSLKTGSGDVETEAHLEVSDGLIETGSGDIAYTNQQTKNMISDYLECGTGSGEITLTNAAVHKLSAHSGSGDIRIQQAVSEDFSIASGSGEVYYSEAQDSKVRISGFTVETASGDVEMHLRNIPVIQTSTKSGKVSVTPNYTTEGVFSITTKSGDIEVKRY